MECNCGSRIPRDTRENIAAHNISIEHLEATMRETGAPEHVIVAAVTERKAWFAICADMRAKGAL